MKEQASKLADQGYVTLAIDLYRGNVATTPEQAHELMRGVPDDRATRDLLAASSYLRSLKQVDPARVDRLAGAWAEAIHSTWRFTIRNSRRR